MKTFVLIVGLLCGCTPIKSVPKLYINCNKNNTAIVNSSAHIEIISPNGIGKATIYKTSQLPDPVEIYLRLKSLEGFTAKTESGLTFNYFLSHQENSDRLTNLTKPSIIKVQLPSTMSTLESGDIYIQWVDCYR